MPRRSIIVPRAWERLLAIESFEALPTLPPRAPQRPRWGKPYREDFRMAGGRIGQYFVDAILQSGGSNYWLEYRVSDEHGAVLFESHDVDFEIVKRQEIHLADDTIVRFHVRFRRTPRRTRTSGRSRRARTRIHPSPA